MATSFSRGYKIKLIGTGLEAGTWGTSTNENLKRIDQYFAGGTDFDVTAASLPSSWNGSSNTLTWCLGDATDAWDTGSEGRNRFVNFTSATSSITVNIRGSTSTDDEVERIYWVRNSLGSNRTITFNNNDSSSSGDFTLRDGATALIHATSAGNVESILGELQLTGIIFIGSDADIVLKDNATAALEIKTTNANEEFIRIDTDNNHLELAPGSAIAQLDLGANTVDTSGQNTLVLTNQNQANSLVFQESGGSTHLLRLDTTTGANKIVFPTEMFIHTGVIDTQNQVTTFEVKDGQDGGDAAGGALRIREGGAGSILFGVRTGTDPVLEVSEAATLKLSGSTSGRNALEVAGTSTFGSNQADFSNINIDGGAIDGTPINNSTIGASTANTGKFTTLEATTASTALHLSAADCYLSLGATAGDGGHGLKDNSGTLNIKNKNTDAWGEPYHSAMVSGQGTYYEGSSAYDDPGKNFEFTHGLTITAQSCPRIVEAWLKLTDSSSQFGYDQYDWILLGSRTGGGDNKWGATVWANTSTVTVTVGGSGLRITNSDATGGDLGNKANVPADSTWSIVVRAWK